MNAASPSVEIDVWSDFVCPFCYLVEPPLQRIESERPGAVHVRWRAFELRPEPEPTLDPKGGYLRTIWERSVYPMAKARGLRLQLPPVQPRSRLAHEFAAFARSEARGTLAQLAVFQAFFEAGADIGQRDVLVRLGRDVGLDEASLQAALSEGRFRGEVQADEDLAATFGFSGVPALVVRRAGDPWERGILLEGAQPYEVISEAVTQLAGPPPPAPIESRILEP